MATTIRPELSDKNKYKISKHRYYELLHFCRQYTDYQMEKKKLIDTCVRPVIFGERPVESVNGDATQRFAMRLANVDDKIMLIEEVAIEAGEDLSSYILTAVTSGISYETLKSRYNIPCGRNEFYERFRKFFWILDKKRG